MWYFAIFGINQAQTSICFNKNYIGVEELKEDPQKITLPKEIQKEMIEFFLKTSIPRIKQKKQSLLSENKSDGGDKK